MAGYLFTFSDGDSLFETMRLGRYSTLMNYRWGPASLSTLGDYATMKSGDSVYFFSKRLVYGIGRITEAIPGQTVLENFDGATGGTVSVEEVEEMEPLLPGISGDGDRIGRWLITFEPDPHMFARGIDMDDLLTSDPDAFRSLRVFWKRTFIKLDDAEDMAFRAAILRRNLDALECPTLQTVIEYDSVRHDIEVRARSRDVRPKVRELIASARRRDGSLATEMGIEVALLDQLSRRDQATEVTFGRWDYLSHQVHASPAKAVDYMDKIDVFGYRWIEGYRPIIERYMVTELKRDTATGEDLQQVMKYVDWVRSNYASGDYNLVRAFLVAHDFDSDSIAQALPTTDRYNLAGYRPPVPNRWHDLTLVRYEALEDGHVLFTIEEASRG